MAALSLAQAPRPPATAAAAVASRSSRRLLPRRRGLPLPHRTASSSSPTSAFSSFLRPLASSSFRTATATPTATSRSRRTLTAASSRWTPPPSVPAAPACAAPPAATAASGDFGDSGGYDMPLDNYSLSPGAGRLSASEAIVLVCDVQERFRTVVLGRGRDTALPSQPNCHSPRALPSLCTGQSDGTLSPTSLKDTWWRPRFTIREPTTS